MKLRTGLASQRSIGSEMKSIYCADVGNDHRVLVSTGDSVSPGQKLVILEAMKMENSILSENSGTVKEVRVRKGDNIDAGEIMIVLA
jgi:biotin carboxyl carrier protein